MARTLLYSFIFSEHIKVTCGVARLLSAATMRLIYTSETCAVNYVSVFSSVVLTFPTTKPCQGIG